MTLPETMQAAIVTAYGGPEVVRIETRPLPPVKDDTVLIRVHATTVNSGDARLRARDAPRGFGTLMRLVAGWRRPRRKVFGTEAAGVVAAVGGKVTRFSVGDPVIGFAGITMGCHAEYVALPESGAIVAKPDNLSFAEAAGLCFGGTTARDFLRKANLMAGEEVLVAGASGAVGAAMVQLAKLAGARVTAVTSAGNADLVESLGADAVIDYAQADFTAAASAYDIIADTVGASDFRSCLGALRPGGRYLAVAGGLADMLARPRDTKRTIAGMAAERTEDMAFLAGLAAEGRYRVVVDSVFPLAEIAKAHARVDTKRKRGSVVIGVAALGA